MHVASLRYINHLKFLYRRCFLLITYVSLSFITVRPTVDFKAMYKVYKEHIVASELNDPICHSNECQIGSFSSEATTCNMILILVLVVLWFSNISHIL